MTETGSGVATPPQAGIHRGQLGDTAPPVTDPDHAGITLRGGNTPHSEWG